MLKKDGTLCLYVNYRSLNKITVKNRYLFLLITKIINYVASINVIFKIDIKEAYY